MALQRFHRDAHAVAHRDGLIMDLGGQQYGRVALGLEPDGRIQLAFRGRKPTAQRDYLIFELARNQAEN